MVYAASATARLRRASSTGSGSVRTLQSGLTSRSLALETTDTILTGAPGYTAAAYGVPTSAGGSLYGTNSPFGLEGGFYYVRLGVTF